MSNDTNSLERLLAPRYRLADVIGRGGMATVYRAHDLRLQRDVAIKVLSAEVASSVNLERFKREISIAAVLQHPHVVPVFDAGGEGELVFYVMPLVLGETLRDRLKREPQLRLDDVIAIAKDVSSALAHAHGHGIVHRDIKPENILFSEGSAVVTDFGIARALFGTTTTTLTDNGVVIGTPTYMSPEQASGGEMVDNRTDIYSLGCVVYEMLAGEPPFSGRTVQAILARQLTERPPSLRIVRPSVPAALQGVVEQALAKDPADRFSSATEFVSALADARTEPAPNETASTERVRKAGQARLVVGAVCVVGALVAAGASWFGARSATPEPNRVVVFPFSELGERDSRGMGEQIALLIGSALEHTEPLRWLDGISLTGRSPTEASRLRHADAARISRQAMAQYYLAGTVLSDRDSTIVIVRLHDAVGDSLLTQESASGAASFATPPQLALRAVTRILARFLPTNGRVDLSYLADRPPGAIADWLLGEREYAHAEYVAALDHMDRALARDSGIGVAALKGAQAAAHLEDYVKARALVGIALRLDRQLPLRHRALARGMQQFMNGAADSALESFTAARTSDTSWSEPWMWTGETYYHLLPATARLDALAEDAFGRAVQLNVGFAPALFHLTELAVLRNDFSNARSLLDRFRRASPDSDWVFQAELTVRCAANGPADIDWRSAADRASGRVVTVAEVLASGARHPKCARSALDAVLARDTASGEMNFLNRWTALEGRFYLAVSQDSAASAARIADSAHTAGVQAAISLHIFSAAAGARESESRADSAMSSLAAKPIDRMQTARLRYMSLWMWHKKDIARMDSVVKRTRSIADSSRLAPDVAVYAAATARLALLRGDSATALRLLRELRPSGEPGGVRWDPFAGLAAERILLAQLLLARHEPRHAIETAELFDSPHSQIHLLYLPASLRVREAAAAELGDAAASQAYASRLRALAHP